MVLSHEPLTIFFPSGLNDAELTKSECPSKVLKQAPVFALLILIVPLRRFLIMLSSPLTILSPSGLNATEKT